MPIRTIIALADMRQLSREWRAAGKKTAFVPTMGALHDGHLALVREAQNKADRVVVSIFVNPIQFGPKEDFASYPRMLQLDSEKLTSLGADVLFAPNAAEMYPAGYETYVYNDKRSDILCGRFRPGHFQGVLTIVSKLFNTVEPDFALFGKKDYQQFTLLRKMAQDLCFPIEVIGHPTLRDPDGLAMSSRNLRLTPEERALAPELYRAMQMVKEALQGGQKKPQVLLDTLKKQLSHVPAFRLEYAEIRAAADLADFGETIDQPAVLLVAAHLGSVRLIDNLELSGP
ncbi:MAG TPA: pantoate--beta-alanine ligase [Oligoflexus sp.]|uniref:pantoate--beta-alanine ligase n=1 Tax=Oligoflexus sp. TaxID=1971216 RepID=UPI002D28067A|nr:pantoate--beta-alanine ligase [Oligoflexus sp.]HYX32034.1 pantoate--beta-alanine ligase [Oligoflexus sp.]